MNVAVRCERARQVRQRVRAHGRVLEGQHSPLQLEASLAGSSPRQLLLSRRFASSLACKVADAALDVV
jgi:hypothetical protein